MPVILLLDVVGSGDNESPVQIGLIGVNTGMVDTIGFTTMVMVAIGAQGSDVGVKV